MSDIELRAIRVVEIPAGASAELVEELLNGPDHASYYLHSLLGQHAIFQLRTTAVKTAAWTAQRAERENADAKADAIIKAHPLLSTYALVGKLTEQGIERSRSWVSRRCAQICTQTSGNV